MNRPGALRVLLVDDDADFIHVLGKRLARRGFAATVALSGAEGLRAMRGREYEAAVLDLKMGDMDGLEVMGIFRKMAPETPVVILTGHGSEASARECLAKGAFGYLHKPCELDELIQMIEAAAAAGGEHAGHPGSVR